MDHDAYLARQAFDGHRHVRRRTGGLPRFEAGAGMLVDEGTGGQVAINRRGRDTMPKSVEKVPRCECPKKSPYTLGYAYGELWKPNKGTRPKKADGWTRPGIPGRVVFNNVQPVPGYSTQHFCVRFLWVCSCEKEPICAWEYLNGEGPADLLPPEGYLKLLFPHVSQEPCTSQLYAIEFFGTKVINIPSPPKHLYQKGADRYVIYRMIEAQIG